MSTGTILVVEDEADLAILDIELPDVYGTDICLRIREESDIPILFVTCKRDADDILSGFEVGADDYVTKPFDPAILVARVKALLRRDRLRRERTVWRYGRLEVDFAKAELWVDGEPVALFAKERQLLHFSSSVRIKYSVSINYLTKSGAGIAAAKNGPSWCMSAICAKKSRKIRPTPVIYKPCAALVTAFTWNKLAGSFSDASCLDFGENEEASLCHFHGLGTPLLHFKRA